MLQMMQFFFSSDILVAYHYHNGVIKVPYYNIIVRQVPFSGSGVSLLFCF